MSNIDADLFLAKRCAMLENLSTFRLKCGPLGIAFRLLEAGRTMDKDTQVELLVIGSKMNGNVLPRSARRGILDGGTYGFGGCASRSNSTWVDPLSLSFATRTTWCFPRFSGVSFHESCLVAGSSVITGGPCLSSSVTGSSSGPVTTTWYRYWPSLISVGSVDVR